MTPFSKVYEAFLTKILDDEWESWMVEEAEQDWHQILNAAIPWFKFPRVSLEQTEEGFVGDLGVSEISILSNYMKCEWLNRCIMTWEHIKPMYEERDFSEANLIDKLRALLEEERKAALWQENIYYRSRSGKPFDYKKLAGNQ